MKDKGCPVCRVVKEREEKTFWWFLTENYHEIRVLEELMDNSFLCGYHAGILAGGDHGSLSYVFQFLIRGDINTLNTLKQSLDGTSDQKAGALSGFLRRPGGSKPGMIDEFMAGYRSCRFCRLNENTSGYIEELFAELLRDDPAFREAYSQSHGLCRRHFIEVLKLSEDKAPSDFLLKDMIRRLDEMKDAFDLYFHKLDYRFADEPKGEEQNTWLQALQYYSGYKSEGNGLE